jgi:hypothetical protein
MITRELIPAIEFCLHHNIEVSFIESLSQSGLIHVTRHEQQVFVPIDELKKLETYVVLYRELDINLEGIETVAHLLQKIEILQQHVQKLNNRL